MFEKRERSWLEEERELERRPWDETWWEKLCRFVRGIFGKKRESETLLPERPTWDWDELDAMYKDGYISANEHRAAHGVPPVIFDEDTFYVNNQAVLQAKKLEQALAAAKYGISAEEMSSRLNQLIL